MKARDNPFATRRVQKLEFRLRDVSWNELMDRLASLKYRAALVGPHGSGKTTLVEAMEPDLLERGFVLKKLRLTEEQPLFDRNYIREFFARLRPCDMVMLDGAEQMSWLSWNRFRWRCRPARGVIITTHRPGRLPMLYSCATDLDLLADLLRDLLGEPLHVSLRIEAEYLFGVYEGNIRDVCRNLYDQFAAGKWGMVQHQIAMSTRA